MDGSLFEKVGNETLMKMILNLPDLVLPLSLYNVC